MTFEASVKGGVTEALTASLLRSVGYRDIPLGVEHSVQELRALVETHPHQYTSVAPALRRLPDFLVLDLEHNWEPRFVEVKYRARDADVREWPDLHTALNVQTLAWGRVYLVIYLGEPYVGAGPQIADAPTNSCRVFKLVHRDGRAQIESLANATRGQTFALDAFDWLYGVPLQEEFTRLDAGRDARTITKAARIVRSVTEALSRQA
jgi:hypothetical protein